MSNLPDNFSLSSFEDRYPAENERLIEAQEQLIALKDTLAGLDKIDEPTDEQVHDMILLEDQISELTLKIEDMEGA